jgi:hypothetical protein
MNQYCRGVTHQQDREVGVILPLNNRVS